MSLNTGVTTGVQKYADFPFGNLNKRILLKEKLCQWLSVFTVMMNRFANPHLQMAVERLENVNAELLTDLIDLIEKRDEGLASVI